MSNLSANNQPLKVEYFGISTDINTLQEGLIRMFRGYLLSELSDDRVERANIADQFFVSQRILAERSETL